MNRILRSKIKTAAFALVCLLCLITSANSHELWVTAFDYEKGLVRSNIGYGHDFPTCEPIAADRITIFEPLRLVTADQTITLDQVGENYAYQKKMSLKKGNYLVVATYRPTFWSNGPEGWAQTDRLQRPDAISVQESNMFGKAVLNVEGAIDDSLVTRPVGQRLEIVPLANPALAKAGQKLPIQVLYDGEPAAGLKVEAAFDQSDDKDKPAFKGTTDTDGKIDIASLKPGYWIVRTKHVYEHPDKTRADKTSLSSSLTFRVGK